MFRGRGASAMNDDAVPRDNRDNQNFRGGKGGRAPQNDRRNDGFNDSPPQRGGFAPRGRGNSNQNDFSSNSGRGRGGGFQQNQGDRQENRSNFGRGRGGFNDRPQNDYERDSQDQSFSSREARGMDWAPQNFNDRRDHFNGPPQRDGMRGGRDSYDQPRNNHFNRDNGSEFNSGRGGRAGFNFRSQNDYEDGNQQDQGFSSRRGMSRGGAPQNFNDRRNDNDDFNSGPPQRGRGGFSNDSPSQRGRGGGFGNDRGCFNCGENNHISRECPEPRQERGGSDRGEFVPRGRSEFGNGRGRSCSSTSHVDFNNERPVVRSFIPKLREIDEIFKDHEDKANSAELYEQDATVSVEGVENNVIIDDWETSGFSPQLIDNIRRSKFLKLRNFQKYAIPLIMDGHDIKGQAETGSGKSAAFLLPIIHMLMSGFEEGAESRRSKVAALIIEPTRELAKQLYEQAFKFAHNTGVTINFAYGEYNMEVNKQSLFTQGCDILIGTPGRLKHLITEGYAAVETLQFLVLDEADRLLDQSFLAAIEDIIQVEKFPSVEERQTLFFSATFERDIQRLANSLCKNKSVIIENVNNDVNNRIKQEILHVPVPDRKKYLLKMLQDEAAANGGRLPKKLVFVETKRDADVVAIMLSDEGIKAQTVNGARPQDLREAATQGFRTGEYLVLVVTNVFARGMDFADLGHVINMYLPNDRDTYVHRIGRTGRLNTGLATSFFDPDHPTDRDMAEVVIRELENAGQEVPDFVRQALNPFGSYQQSSEYAAPSRNNYGNDQDDSPGLEAPDF